jgi:hypothetical protein
MASDDRGITFGAATLSGRGYGSELVAVVFVPSKTNATNRGVSMLEQITTGKSVYTSSQVFRTC